MAAKIIIRRRVPDACAGQMERYIRLLRATAMKQTGYFYGATEVSADDPYREYVVTSTWQSFDHWERWWASAERSYLQSKIDQLADGRTQYQVHAD